MYAPLLCFASIELKDIHLHGIIDTRLIIVQFPVFNMATRNGNFENWLFMTTAWWSLKILFLFFKKTQKCPFVVRWIINLVVLWYTFNIHVVLYGEIHPHYSVSTKANIDFQYLFLLENREFFKIKKMF